MTVIKGVKSRPRVALHNCKEEDFQLFLALLDQDRFEGRFREGVHEVDISDIMRRMIKEDLRRFDGCPLFPERRAYTVRTINENSRTLKFEHYGFEER